MWLGTTVLSAALGSVTTILHQNVEKQNYSVGSFCMTVKRRSCKTETLQRNGKARAIRSKPQAASLSVQGYLKFYTWFIKKWRAISKTFKTIHLSCLYLSPCLIFIMINNKLLFCQFKRKNSDTMIITNNISGVSRDQGS